MFRGSERFLENETTPVISPAAKDLAERAEKYSPEHPLYVVAIGAITNVASAILLNPKVAENCVIVWLGGHAQHYHDTKEFNMYQDVAAARVVMQSGAPFVQLPCMGVVSAFYVTESELERWLKGKNKISDYLAENTIGAAHSSVRGKVWSRVIWDVTAVAWLLNDNNCFMQSRMIQTPVPTYDGLYAQNYQGVPMQYVYNINRDELMRDLFDKLTK